ncbi:MAG: HDIG domain-containing protein [Candidatus Bipolaricaulota bacterium]
MSAARRNRIQEQRRSADRSPFPWLQLTLLLLLAAAGSVWCWRDGLSLCPWPMAAASSLGLVLPSLAVALVISPEERRLGLGLLAAAVILSKLGSIGSPFLMPWGVASSMVALLISPAHALLSLLPLAGWAAPMFGGGPTLSALVGAAALALVAGRARTAKDLLLAGLAGGLAGAVVAATLWPESGFAGTAAALLCGPAAAFITWAELPAVERATDRTSPLSLVDLLNPSHPLLERMRAEAPGSYYHSRDVAALAEAAARAVSANPVLAAVGGLYHDLGKLLRPHFFGENQSGTNPHEELSPSMSKVVLASHVKDGIELGRRYGLKGDVLQFVASHHGTSVMRAFFELAAEKGVSEDEFRYDSPLPDTKESAIVMLADSVEAYARGKDRDDLRELVERAIEDRRRDGQLDRSPLTFAELARIRRAFTSALQGMTHRRTGAFPEPKEGR